MQTKGAGHRNITTNKNIPVLCTFNEVSDHLISINISRLRLPLRRTLWQAGHSEAAGRSAAEPVLQEDNKNFINQNQSQHIKILFSTIGRKTFSFAAVFGARNYLIVYLHFCQCLNF